MKDTRTVHGIGIVLALLLVLLPSATSFAQGDRPTVQVRLSGGAAFSRFPDLADLSQKELVTYENPGATPTVGLSGVVWVSQELNISLGVQFDQFTVSVNRFDMDSNGNPSGPPSPYARWELQGFTGTLGCEYRLPVQVGPLTPFAGVGLGYSTGSLTRELFTTNAFINGPTLNKTGTSDPYSLSAKAGFSFVITTGLEVLISAEYWKTGNLWSMDGRKAGTIDMYLTGWRLLLSLQM